MKRKRKWLKGPELVTAVADLADSLGIYARDLHKEDKAQINGAKIRVRDLTGPVASKADHHNAEEVKSLILRYGANQKKTVWVDPELDLEDVVTVTPSKAGKTRARLFGFHVTSVIRWMGADGWDFADVRKAMDHYNLDPADATIKCQLRAGKKGTSRPAAPLKPYQKDELYEAME